jgi:hypothetical protein
MSSWYTRGELAHRIAWFYSGSSLANAFGGLIGAGVLGNLSGAHGIAGCKLQDMTPPDRTRTDESREVAVHHRGCHHHWDCNYRSIRLTRLPCDDKVAVRRRARVRAVETGRGYGRGRRGWRSLCPRRGYLGPERSSPLPGHCAPAH